MPELGLFPLPTVLLPTERLPLHVFEERYKELIGECLAHERPFGLVLADDRGVREVGTAATVVAVLDRAADGRLNIVVEGGDRFRVARPTSGRSFATAEVEPVHDDERAAAPEALVERAAAALRRLAELTGTELDELERPTAYALAARVELDPALKQELLELRSETSRLERVARVFERAETALQRQREAAELAKRNGHARRPS